MLLAVLAPIAAGGTALAGPVFPGPPVLSAPGEPVPSRDTAPRDDPTTAYSADTRAADADAGDVADVGAVASGPAVAQPTATGAATPVPTATEPAPEPGTVGSVGGGAEVLRDELIGPSLGAELARGGLIALVVALAAEFAYLAVRFRWTLGAGAVAALTANVLVVVGVFAWTGRTADGVFLAALLTVIGYSVNDTVVVFDRVREHWSTQSGPFHRVVGSAVLSTLPRTVNTGISTLVILSVLLGLGGATLADFALALIVGIVVGTASTIVVAGPVAILLQRRWSGASPARPRPAPRPAGKARRRARPPSRADGAVV